MNVCSICATQSPYFPAKVETESGELICLLCSVWYLNTPYCLLLLNAARKMRRMAA